MPSASCAGLLCNAPGELRELPAAMSKKLSSTAESSTSGTLLLQLAPAIYSSTIFGGQL
jgi:hypothetical protein